MSDEEVGMNQFYIWEWFGEESGIEETWKNQAKPINNQSIYIYIVINIYAFNTIYILYQYTF